jgi:DNA-binding transcriptional MerR regulator
MRASTIDKLDVSLRAEINRLRVDKGYSIDQILEYLKAMNASVSRSAMGRHVKKLAEVGARIREARAVAEGIAPTLSGKDDGQLLNINVELLQAAAMRVMSATDDSGEDVQLTSKEAMELGKALESSAKALKINADRVLKIEQAFAKKAVKVVEAVAAKTPGMSREFVDEIKLKVLGLPK